MDYEKIGFKAGLEIHQQLDTHKLFCKCQSVIKEDGNYSFGRFLRPTQKAWKLLKNGGLKSTRLSGYSPVWKKF